MTLGTIISHTLNFQSFENKILILLTRFFVRESVLNFIIYLQFLCGLIMSALEHNIWFWS